jgi:hypothetical protein
MMDAGGHRQMGGAAGRTTTRWRHHVRAAVVRALLVATLLPAGLARAGTWGVVGADADADALAADVRRALQPPAGDTVLDEDVLRERLSPPIGPVKDLAAARALLAAADTAFNAVEHEKSVSYLESLIADLEGDTTFSADKLAVLQTARLQAARRLLGLAGPGETGRAETRNGARARSHLAAALRADPTLVLDPASTPPKLRALLSLASEDVKQGGHGSIAVKSVPAGATVVLEGRPQGLTPLVTASTIASGRYRLWLEKDGRVSLPRVITVGTSPVSAEINLVIEGALRPAGPGLSPPLQAFTTDDVARIARRVDVDRFVVIGRDGADVWAAVFGRDGGLRQGFRGSDVDGARLAGIVAAAGTADASVLPPSFFTTVAAPVEPVATAAPVAVTDDDAGVPWLGIGLGVAGGVVAIAGVAAAVVLLSSEQTTVGVTVRRAE